MPESPAPIAILSFDGGGIRGYSSLQILEQVMLDLKRELNLPETPKPCDYFDLIGGTSTGGIIAILLGRLRLSVADALQAYDSVAGQAFVPRTFHTATGGKYKADSLKKVIKDVVRDKDVNGDPEALFVDLDAPKTVVLAITTIDVDSGPTLFRSYDDHPSWTPCKIWEIARATSAAYSYFEAISIGRDHIKFMDAGFGHNNPCLDLVEEAKQVLPGRSIGCILSIGTGLSRAVEASNLASVAKALVKMATSSKNIHRQMQGGELRDVYFRLDENAGIDDIKLDNYKKMGALAGLTSNYLRQPDTKTKIKSCVDSIVSLRGELIADEPVVAEPLYFEVDYSRNPKFVQQIEALAYLQERFLPNTQSKIRKAVIYGTGGIGKSQIALEYAYSSQYTHSVFWINADTRQSLEQRIKEIVGSLRSTTTFEDTGQTNVERAGAAIRTFRRYLETQLSGWLLILDNVNEAGIITGLLPTRGQGDILCTTRNQSIVGSDLFPDKGFKVRAMAERSAIILYLNRLLATLDSSQPEIQSLVDILEKKAVHGKGNSRMNELLNNLDSEYGISEYSELQEITQLVGRLPLGLVQSAAYMSATNYRVSFQEYKNRLRLSGKRRLAFFNFNLSSSYDQNLWSVWKLNFGEIRGKCPEAADLMNLMAFFDRRSLTPEFLSHILDDGKYLNGGLVFKMNLEGVRDMSQFLPYGDEGADLATSLSELSKLSLLDTGPTIEIHKLVQDYVLHQMETLEYTRFLQYAVALLKQNLPPLLYSKTDRMVPSLSNQVLSHIGRLGQVIRENEKESKLEISLRREIAILFLTAYRWNWDPEDLDLAAKMMQKEKPHNWLMLLINSSRLFLEVSKQMQGSRNEQNLVRVQSLKHDLLGYSTVPETPQTLSLCPLNGDRNWVTIASTLRDYAEPMQVKPSSLIRGEEYDKTYQLELKQLFDDVRRFLYLTICKWASEEVVYESINAISQLTLLVCFSVPWFDLRDSHSKLLVARASTAIKGLDLGVDEIQGFDDLYFEAFQKGYGDIQECLGVVKAFCNVSDELDFERIPFPFMLELHLVETKPVWTEFASHANNLSLLPWPPGSFGGPALIALREVLVARLMICLEDSVNKSTPLWENAEWLWLAGEWEITEDSSDFQGVISLCKQLLSEHNRIFPTLDHQEDEIESCSRHEHSIETAMIYVARTLNSSASDMLKFYETCYQVTLQRKGIENLATQEILDKLMALYQNSDVREAENLGRSTVNLVKAANIRSEWANNLLLRYSSEFSDFDIKECIAMERHGYALQDLIICARLKDNQTRVIWTRSSTPSKPPWSCSAILHDGLDSFFFKFCSGEDADSFAQTVIQTF